MAFIRGTFFRLQGYKMVGNLLVEVCKRVARENVFFWLKVPKGLTGAF